MIKTRKGFLFVVTIFLILTYILLSISVWVKAIEASERSYSEFYKESNVELAIEQITEERITEVSTMVLNRGLIVLADHSVNHWLKQGPNGPEDYSHIEASLGEFLVNGSPKAEHFEDGQAPSEYHSSMSAWADNLNASLSSIGVYVVHFSIQDFSLSQKSHDKLEYSYSLSFTMRDKAGSTSVERDRQVKGEIDLNGFRDPAIMRESNGKVASRRIFFNSAYDEPSSLLPKEITGFAQEAGQGWFYGFVVEFKDADSIPAYERKQHMVAGTYSQLSAYPGIGDFGAMIVTTPPSSGATCTDSNNVLHEGEKDTFNPISHSGTDCSVVLSSDGTATTLPFVVAPKFNISEVPLCPPMNGSATLDRHCMLFVSAASGIDELEKKKQPSNIHFYDIEDLRDFTFCGYYTQNSKSPSFLQRLFNQSYTLSSNEFGIETFIIGNYAVIAFGNSAVDGLSNLDREFFLETGGPYSFIRGMPGCKDRSMCQAPNDYTGRFSLTDSTIQSDYPLGVISCGNNLARCD